MAATKSRGGLRAANVLHHFVKSGLVSCFHHSVISLRARMLFELLSVVLGRGLL